ncbi:hypothetical protein PV327_011116, partial [Microctonus hyperodae]
MKKVQKDYKNLKIKLPSGRRIVDLDKLAEEMWCQECDLPLSFRFCVNEDICEFASVFHIKCSKCGTIHLVRSSTNEGKSTKSKYHVNFKVALAILDGGIGETQLNTILSALNVPTINHNSIKRYERLVGPAIETVVKDSCHEALKVERELTILNEGYCNSNDEASIDSRADNVKKFVNFYVEADGVENKLNNDATFSSVSTDVKSVKSLIQHESNTEEDLKNRSQNLHENCERKLESIKKNIKIKKERIGLRLSYDGAWLKKGSGRCYNSRQGYGTAFGHYSRKCVAYATRNKRCRYCRISSKKKHDCGKNFIGSSKAMEADIAVGIFTKNDTFVKENVEIKTLIGDEDSSTIANLRRASSHQIDKWTDIIHATRKISKFLYAIKKIPKAAIEYLLYCFNCALRANEGSVNSTKAAILNIVPHAFGEHDSYGSWCNYGQNPEAFRHKYLPGGKPLTGDTLKKSILPIFKQAADNAEKLAPRASSQINENCNAVITSNAPKAKCYSDSRSSDSRVAAGISQVNLGRNYLSKVISTLGLSPIKNKSLLYRIKRDEKRKKMNSLMKTTEFNTRRRALFRNRQKLNASAEAREGITYQSNSEIDASLEINDKSITYIAPTVHDTTKLVIFDIETTGLNLTDEIVQIAAQCNGRYI